MQQLYIFLVGNLNVELKEVGRVWSGQTFCRQSRVGSGQRFAGSGRVGSKKSDPWTTLSGRRVCETRSYVPDFFYRFPIGNAIREQVRKRWWHAWSTFCMEEIVIIWKWDAPWFFYMSDTTLDLSLYMHPDVSHFQNWHVYPRLAVTVIVV